MAEPLEKFVVPVQYSHTQQKIRLEIPYSDYNTLIRRGYSKAEVTLIDDRKLSDKQRKACYAMLGEIAEYMGETKQDAKELMKLEFMTSELYETGERLFSMSNASMSVISAFQKYLARFIISKQIPTKKPLIGYVDDIHDYVYTCLEHKTCACCGQKADLHHVDAVGAGRNRETIIHEGMQALPLCRVHHEECHNMGNKDFLEKWHLEPVKLDKRLCKKYKLKTDE